MSAEATKDLVKKAQSGEKPAFSLLVERYQDKLEFLIHVRMGARLRLRIEADDVFQETLLQAWKSLQDFSSSKDGSFFSWLGGISEHVIQNLDRRYFKTRKRDPRREVAMAQLAPAWGKEDSGDRPSFELASAEDCSPSKGLRRSERFDRLEMALNELSPVHREVILLAFIQELPVKEVSRRLGRAPKAVSMLIFRALGRLRAILGNTDSFHLPAGSLLKATFTGTGLPAERRPLEQRPGGSGGS
jgi:RNA polymerase sigma-70 factor (ECF subfamily)